MEETGFGGVFGGCSLEQAETSWAPRRLHPVVAIDWQTATATNGKRSFAWTCELFAFSIHVRIGRRKVTFCIR